MGNNGQGIDLQAAANTAKTDGKDDDGGLFDSALGFLQGKKDSGDTDVDEDEVQRAHTQAYDQVTFFQCSTCDLKSCSRAPQATWTPPRWAQPQPCRR
jgi:hypothetical protein